MFGDSALYILPSESDAGDFSSGRFDPALELSDHLSGLFSDVKNTGHKRAGDASLYVRGSRSKSKLKSIPAGRLVFDEVDEMVQEHIPLAIERASGQIRKSFDYISTPTIENFGIALLFEDSDPSIFTFRCPRCGKHTYLCFPDCLIITADDPTDGRIKDSHLICKECKNELPHGNKPDFLKNGIWVPQVENKIARGFHINQLYSCTIQPYEIAQSYLRSLTNPADEQEFHNSKMGETHTVEGAKCTDEQFLACISEKNMLHGCNDANHLYTIGIDVGTYLNVVIYQWHMGRGAFDNYTTDLHRFCTPRIILATKIKEFEEIHEILHKYLVNFCVIDANPERRKALEFARDYPGKVRLCFYGNGSQKREITVSPDENEPTITVDRTSWLDITIPRFVKKKIVLPRDIGIEFQAHVTALTRIYEKDKDGNPTGRWVCGNAADHYAHACNYAEIALPLAHTVSQNFNLPESVL
jgi:hypothetical protein